MPMAKNQPIINFREMGMNEKICRALSKSPKAIDNNYANNNNNYVSNNYENSFNNNANN